MKAGVNDTTGDRLISKAPTKKYRDRHEAIFGKRGIPEAEEKEERTVQLFDVVSCAPQLVSFIRDEKDLPVKIRVGRETVKITEENRADVLYGMMIMRAAKDEFNGKTY